MATTQNLEVVRTDAERGLLMIKGAVPGAKGGYVLVQDAIKAELPKEAPKPAGIRKADAAKPLRLQRRMLRPRRNEGEAQ